MEALIARKDGSYGSTEEVQRGVAGALDPAGRGRPEYPATAMGAAIKRIADQLGIYPEALRTWVRQAAVERVRAGTTTEDRTLRIAELEREARKLKRANETLRTASAFFAATELDRKLK